MKDRKIDALAKIGLFSASNRKELEHIAALVDEVDLAPGTELTHEGRVGAEVYIIQDGTATVTIGGETVATVGPGDVVGEMALLDHKPRSATVVADTPIHAFVLDERSFQRLLDEASVARKMMGTISARLRGGESA